ncbi:glycoside hydrolase family 16 protein [Serratia aquatilis]|uniref:Glycoside hydrolase family 16 protein n=1 Tax=Serratia aquatilis TaxID=1737515 RepID=A0ABV6E7Q4_9GAMM
MKVAEQKYVEGKKYQLEFYDGFDRGYLDETNWLPYYLPQWSSRELSAPRFEFSEAGFLLKIAKDQKPWCPEFNGTVRVSSLQTGVYAGKVGTPIGQHRFSPDCVVREEQIAEKKYLPKYGYFELRAKCDIAESNVAALWMIGYEDLPERSAEICIFELKGKNIHNKHALIGYGVHPFGDKKIVDEFYEQSFDLDVTVFNTYAIAWSEEKIEFFINDRKVRTINQSPDYEMQLMLNIYDLENINAENMCFYIDYVAGFRITDR